MKNLIFVLIIIGISNSVFSKSQAQVVDSSTFYFDIGLKHYKSRNFDSALIFFNRSIEHNPKNDLAYFRRAMVQEDLNDLESAIKDYLIAIEISPQALYFNNLGLDKAIQGKYEEAIKIYNEGLSYDESFADIYWNMGVAYHYMEEFEKACENISKAYELGFGMAKQYLEQYCE